MSSRASWAGLPWDAMSERGLVAPALRCVLGASREWRAAFLAAGYELTLSDPRLLRAGSPWPALSASLRSLTVSFDCSRFDAPVGDRMLLGLAPLTNLVRLSIRGCFWVTGEGMRSLSGLSHLERLDMTNCRRLDDRGFEALRGMPLLSSLRVSGTLEGLSDGTEALLCIPTSVTTLDLSDNLLFSGRHLADLARLPALERLVLDNCCLRDLSGLRLLPPLRRLRMRQSILAAFQAEGGRSHWCAQATQLTHIDLSYAIFTGIAVSDCVLSALPASLTALKLSMMRGLSPAALRELRHLTALTRLDLSQCGNCVNDASLGELRALPALTDLDLGHCNHLTNDGLRALLDLPAGLRKLDIAGCDGFTGDREEYDDYGNYREDDACDILGGLRSLTGLRIDGFAPPRVLEMLRELPALTSLHMPSLPPLAEQCFRLVARGVLPQCVVTTH